MDTDLMDVARFVRLVEDLTAEALFEVRIDTLPARDRTYVRHLQILVQEDASLIERQRLVWLKLRHGIRLLESEAKELLEVLQCRGFYFSGLNLDGMVFSTLDISNGWIAGDFSCQHTLILGLCDERDLVVAGRYLTDHRRVGEQVTDGRQSLNTSIDTDDIEELTDDDIIASYMSPCQPATSDRSRRPLFPRSVPPYCPGPAGRRYSLVPHENSSRCSRPPRTSVAQRSARPTLRPFFGAATHRIDHAGREASRETDEIDMAWE